MRLTNLIKELEKADELETDYLIKKYPICFLNVNYDDKDLEQLTTYMKYVIKLMGAVLNLEVKDTDGQ